MDLRECFTLKGVRVHGQTPCGLLFDYVAPGRPAETDEDWRKVWEELRSRGFKPQGNPYILRIQDGGMVTKRIKMRRWRKKNNPVEERRVLNVKLEDLRFVLDQMGFGDYALEDKYVCRDCGKTHTVGDSKVVWYIEELLPIVHCAGYPSCKGWPYDWWAEGVPWH